MKPSFLRTLAWKVPFLIGYPIGAIKRGISIGASESWEGYKSTRYRSHRSRVTESQDSAMDMGVREDMLSEARKLSQTFPIVRKINRQYANHCVGSCRIKWATGNSAIDRAYADAWQNWMRIADLSGLHHFRKLTKIALGSMLRDGEFAGQLDRRGGFLQIAAIEADRVSSDGSFNKDTDTCVGGILLDANGRERAMRVWDRNSFGTFSNPREIPRAEYVRMFDSDRADARRGVTHYHTVLDAIRDLKETGVAERLAAKRNSKLALLVKTMAGAAGTRGRIDLWEGDDTTEDGNAVQCHAVNDVADAYMFPQEDIKAHTSERPSQGWQWLMEWLVREIANGLDLPFGVVWNMAGLGGPAARFEIAQANRVFRATFQDVLEPMWIRPIVGAWISMQISGRKLPFSPNWYQFMVPPPESLTIDLGRDSKAGIAENEAGLLTATGWYAEMDEDFETATDRLAYEARYRMDAAERAGVPVEQIRNMQSRGGTGAPTNAGEEPPKKNDDEEVEETGSNRPARRSNEN